MIFGSLACKGFQRSAHVTLRTYSQGKNHYLCKSFLTLFFTNSLKQTSVDRGHLSLTYFFQIVLLFKTKKRKLPILWETLWGAEYMDSLVFEGYFLWVKKKKSCFIFRKAQYHRNSKHSVYPSESYIYWYSKKIWDNVKQT